MNLDGEEGGKGLDKEVDVCWNTEQTAAVKPACISFVSLLNSVSV